MEIHERQLKTCFEQCRQCNLRPLLANSRKAWIPPWPRSSEPFGRRASKAGHSPVTLERIGGAGSGRSDFSSRCSDRTRSTGFACKVPRESAAHRHFAPHQFTYVGGRFVLLDDGPSRAALCEPGSTRTPPGSCELSQVRISLDFHVSIHAPHIGRDSHLNVFAPWVLSW